MAKLLDFRNHKGSRTAVDPEQVSLAEEHEFNGQKLLIVTIGSFKISLSDEDRTGYDRIMAARNPKEEKNDVAV